MVGNVEGEGDHALRKGLVGAAVVDEAIEIIFDLLSDGWDVEKLIRSDCVIPHKGYEGARLFHLRNTSTTCELSLNTLK